MIPHEEIRKNEDRSWTFKLIDIIMKSAPDEDLEAVCRTLDRLGDPRAIEPLIKILENTDLPYHVRAAAGDVLQSKCIARCEADRRSWWASGDKLLMKHALLEARTSEADIILPIANDPTHEFYCDAIDGMEFGFEEPEHKVLLCKALEHSSAEVRGIAVRNLSWDEPICAEDGLIKLLYDSDADVAYEALQALQWYDSQKSLLSLVGLQSCVRDSLRDDLLSAISNQLECFQSAYERLSRECHPFFLTWLKPIQNLLHLESAETQVVDATPKHPPRASREKTLLRSAKEVISFFDDPDACWSRKHRFRLECKWDEFSSADREETTEYFRNHPDHSMREFGCCALAAWNRNDILETFLLDACGGVKRTAAYHLKKTSRDESISATIFSVYQDINSTGGLAKELLEAYVVHAPRAGLEDLLADIALNERRLSRKYTAVCALRKLGAHTHFQSLLCLLAEPPLINWSVHRELVEYCVERKISVPYFADLCKVDDLYLQESLAKAVPYLKPVLLKGVSYAAKN